MAPQLPRSLQGLAPALAIGQIGQFGIRAGQSTDMVQASFEAEYAAAAGTSSTAPAARPSMPSGCSRAPTPRKYAPENGAQYPRTPYGDALKQIAQLIKADVGLEVAFAETGNWDHHAQEGAAVGQLANRLADFSGGIAALVRDLGDRMDDVMILTMSEFGRTVAENGNRGTDHGHGNAMMMIGGGVRGGKVYGKWPGLAREQRYEGRDLAVTTDFRTVFAEVAGGHLGLTNTAHVFPGFKGPVTVGAVA